MAASLQLVFSWGLQKPEFFLAVSVVGDDTWTNASAHDCRQVSILSVSGISVKKLRSVLLYTGAPSLLLVHLEAYLPAPSPTWTVFAAIIAGGGFSYLKEFLL